MERLSVIEGIRVVITGRNSSDATERATCRTLVEAAGWLALSIIALGVEAASFFVRDPERAGNIGLASFAAACIALIIAGRLCRKGKVLVAQWRRELGMPPL